MLIFSFKAQNAKFIMSVIVCIVAIVLTVTLIPKADDFVYPEGVLPAVKNLGERDFKGMSDNDKRVNLLKKYGREVENNPVEIKEVIIPEKFDAVYKKYNELQKTEGFDLSRYKGKTVKRYTYIVTNDEWNGTVYANLLIYKDKLIGGDISTADYDGFVKGFTVGNDYLF